MTIWVDADACPRELREVICRAAERVQVAAWFVANQQISLPPGPFARCLQVAQGFDVADNTIVERVCALDLVITQDVPLAAAVIERGAKVITQRGEEFTPANIRQRLTLRNFMEEMRASGERTGGPAAYSARDKQQFSNALDRYLAQWKKQQVQP